MNFQFLAKKLDKKPVPLFITGYLNPFVFWHRDVVEINSSNYGVNCMVNLSLG
jgi:hypothetical protein